VSSSILTFLHPHIISNTSCPSPYTGTCNILLLICSSIGFRGLVSFFPFVPVTTCMWGIIHIVGMYPTKGLYIS
jgi:hypothetical protein